MKPHIDQSLLDQLPIKPFESARFHGSNTQNMIYFYWYFTMEDDREEVVATVKHSISFDKRILN